MTDQTFCIYCQVEYRTPEALVAHIRAEHANTYAARSVAGEEDSNDE